MNEKNYSLLTSDKKSINVYEWISNEKHNKGIIQIIHGMAEHAGRYREFAKVLNQNGYSVIAGDLRGHGKTEKNLNDIGFFAKKNGWEIVLNDIYLVTKKTKEKFPGLPFYIFGHSMGSFFARDYMHTYGKEIKGVILSGTGGDPGIIGNIGISLAKREIKKNGIHFRSTFLDKLTFGNYNKKFEPARTKFDWLSRDNKKVDEYIKDPLCGNISTSCFFLDLFTGIKKINKKNNIRKIPENLPVLFFSGTKDPVGNNAKGVRQIYKKYRKNKNLILKLYKEGRHEMINEINRTEVFNDIVNWLDDSVKPYTSEKSSGVKAMNLCGLP